ncbi:hypothetical protein HUJ05_000071 [Dendroctonus ponderosae]|nr:hypothetical protein HUJ05_000071 [Dendroctonus ponderosae]
MPASKNVVVLLFLFKNILLLSQKGLAPNLYATFENGLAYKFQPGCTLTKETVRNKEIYTLVAKKMAKLHKVKVDGVNNPKPFIWKKTRDFLNLVPEEFSSLKTQKSDRKQPSFRKFMQEFSLGHKFGKSGVVKISVSGTCSVRKVNPIASQAFMNQPEHYPGKQVNHYFLLLLLLLVGLLTCGLDMANFSVFFCSSRMRITLCLPSLVSSDSVKTCSIERSPPRLQTFIKSAPIK